MIECIGCDKPISSRNIMCASCWLKLKLNSMDRTSYKIYATYFKGSLMRMLPKLERKDRIIVRDFIRRMEFDEINFGERHRLHKQDIGQVVQQV